MFIKVNKKKMFKNLNIIFIQKIPQKMQITGNFDIILKFNLNFPPKNRGLKNMAS